MMAIGQGLEPDPSALMAPVGYASLKAVYAKSKAWQAAYRLSRRSACSERKGSLCSNGLGMEERAQLLMATSPQSYDSRTAEPFNVVGKPKDQDQCGSCVAFAVLGAAQSAIASALKQRTTTSFSEQDFHFCKVPKNVEASCSDALSLESGVTKWLSLVGDKNFVLTDQCLPYDPYNPRRCSPKCSSVDPSLYMGYFKRKTFSTTWEMQEHIRSHGSVVCRIDVYSDFKPFFKNHPTGVYKGPGTWGIPAELALSNGYASCLLMLCSSQAINTTCP
jgi:hypothetical protein